MASLLAIVITINLGWHLEDMAVSSLGKVVWLLMLLQLYLLVPVFPDDYSLNAQSSLGTSQSTYLHLYPQKLRIYDVIIAKVSTKDWFIC